MKYVINKILLTKQIQSLHKSGGKFQQAAHKINKIICSVAMGNENPLSEIQTTNNGETRIKHCVKYDLPGFCRLITIQDNGICAIIYAGKHDECDKWLNANKGYTLTLKNNELIGLVITDNIVEVTEIQREDNPITGGNLISKIKGHYLDIILENISASIYRKIQEFDCFTNDDEMILACLEIKQEKIQEMILDVLIALKEDDIDRAKNRILIFEDKIKTINQALEEDVKSIVSGEQYILLDDFMDRDIQKLVDGSTWLDWMLFMHPQQRQVVESDFAGTARLLGVSGSGKTCVTVNRAIRLAKKYKTEKILITTINMALATLIKQLLTIATESDKEFENIKDLIEVKSFWELSRELLLEFEEDPLKRKGYNQYADKSLEDVDEIWEEYFSCQYNNTDAEILQPINQSLLSRNVLPLEYIKQEFDWIRSALTLQERPEYLNIERIGRSEPLIREQRKLIIEGLLGWENKMEAVGVCDYLGLIGPLHNYKDLISSRYRCILVDELQDFGTTELSIIRMLVDKNENDIFLCGDIAQQVQIKHQMITKAGIQPTNYLTIKKNYRNSREILEAASDVFKNNIDPSEYNQGGFQLLDPEYANFASPKPFIRKTKNIDEELKFSISYLRDILTEKEKGCIAICGLTYFQVKTLGNKLDINVLDDKLDVNISKLWISDLDQTKGFEFDRMIIINCSQGIFPNQKLPEREWFREISKLYVSMTRAKRELIISYSNELSSVFSNSLNFFNIDSNWQEYVDIDNTIKIPIINSAISLELFELKKKGIDFLRSSLAIGLSQNSQEKIFQLVQGKKSTNSSGFSDEWVNMETFIKDIHNPRIVPHMNRLLGPSVYKELKEKFVNSSTIKINY